MPAIFRIECSACGQGPDFQNSLAGWVATDGRKGGSILPEGYLALKLDAGEFVALPHPIEESTLKEHGFTWGRAAKEARLFRVTFKICTACGLMHEERQIQTQRFGCNLAFAGAVAGFFLFRYGLKFNWWLALLVAYFAGFAFLGLVALIDKSQWREANEALKLRKCSSCGNAQFTTISKAVGKLLPCPFCKTRNMKFTMAGIS